MSGTKEGELKIWNDLLEHDGRRECATYHWAGELAGHARSLQRMGLIDEEELCEMLELADAAYSHVREQLDTQSGCETKRPRVSPNKREKLILNG